MKGFLYIFFLTGSFVFFACLLFLKGMVLIMNNRFIRISQDGVFSILKQSNTNQKKCLVELDGNLIKTSCDYYTYIEKILSFPRPCEMIVDRYLDWIRDLSWFDYDSYCFIIYNYTVFLEEDIQGRNKIFSDFENIVFPWWEKNVVECCAGGRTKEFIIYLVQ